MSTFSVLLLFLLGLTAILVSGCASGAPPSAYRVQIPELRANPLRLKCDQDPDQGCIALLYADYVAILRELRAACLGLGGSRKECGAE